AFRVKQDVVPGRYTTMWFEATQTGEYHLFCAEYCGTQHSGMIGRVVVMEPSRFEAWLRAGAGAAGGTRSGERLMADLGCWSCHLRDDPRRGPALYGLVGRTVTLEGGATLVADADYIRESI